MHVTCQETTMKRIGTILIFQPNVTKAEAAMALNGIGHLLVLPKRVSGPKAAVQARLDAGETVRYRREDWQERDFRMTDKIEEFDDEWGFPVWYVP